MLTRKISGLAFLLFICATCSCSHAKAEKSALSSEIEKTETDMTPQTQPADTNSVLVKIETSVGDFTVLLYGDTPAHRDNFVKLAQEGFYNGTLFHRVIDKFMVQAGDPDSKNAQAGQMLGAGGPGYTLPAEINYPKHFHKRGALAAARQGDQINPERRSSGSQFYVVTGNRYIPAQLDAMEAHIKQQLMQSEFNRLASQHMDQVRQLQQQGNNKALEQLRLQLISEAETAVNSNFIGLTPEIRQAYSEVGGTPSLDGQYTVFGEVVQGMDVVDKIEKAETNAADRPNEDIVIKKMTVIRD